MARKYTDMLEKEAEILQMREAGLSRKQIAATLGLNEKQINNWVTRYNRRKEATMPPHKRGRPRSKPLTTEEAMAKRIKELEMEVDLYKSFLQEVGRRRELR